jgi:hypothetical protein
VKAKRTVISIAMARYNGERFPEEQPSSLSEQVRLPNESVICDDGSYSGNLGAIFQTVSGSARHQRSTVELAGTFPEGRLALYM